jgi:hypothetical protein
MLYEPVAGEASEQVGPAMYLTPLGWGEEEVGCAGGTVLPLWLQGEGCLCQSKGVAAHLPLGQLTSYSAASCRRSHMWLLGGCLWFVFGLERRVAP